MKNHYHNIQASLLKLCATLSQKLRDQGVPMELPVNLDAFTQEADWPEGNFIGLGEFHLVMDSIYEGSAAVALSLSEDTNLLRTSEFIGYILDDLLPNSSIPVVDVSNGDILGLLLVKGGVQVAPPYATKTRPLVPIIFAFTSNLQTG